MTECQRCSGRSQLFLCPGCVEELGEMLYGLVGRESLNSLTGETCRSAGWISLLEDAAHGQTRLGVSVRRSTELSGPLPFNERASELLDQATETLQHWVAAVNLNNEQLGIEER